MNNPAEIYCGVDQEQIVKTAISTNGELNWRTLTEDARSLIVVLAISTPNDRSAEHALLIPGFCPRNVQMIQVLGLTLKDADNSCGICDFRVQYDLNGEPIEFVPYSDMAY